MLWGNAILGSNVLAQYPNPFAIDPFAPKKEDPAIVQLHKSYRPMLPKVTDQDLKYYEVLHTELRAKFSLFLDYVANNENNPQRPPELTQFLQKTSCQSLEAAASVIDQIIDCQRVTTFDPIDRERLLQRRDYFFVFTAKTEDGKEIRTACINLKAWADAPSGQATAVLDVVANMGNVFSDFNARHDAMRLLLLAMSSKGN